jgi:hypothetical protein
LTKCNEAACQGSVVGAPVDRVQAVEDLVHPVRDPPATIAEARRVIVDRVIVGRVIVGRVIEAEMIGATKTGAVLVADRVDCSAATVTPRIIRGLRAES